MKEALFCFPPVYLLICFELKGMYVLIGPKQRISPKREISTYFSLIKSQKIINATFKNRKAGNINPRHERFG